MSWFQKFIGCAFCMDIQGKPEEVVFWGTCENPNTTSDKPLQYYFEGEKSGNIIVPYKEARIVMGAMIDMYKK